MLPLKKRISVIMISLVILFSGCSSATLIQSYPSGARVYLNGEAVGNTPYKHVDTRITGSNNHLKLVHEGYEDFNTMFSRDEQVDVGAVIGGFFVWIPFLWCMKYKPTHTYDLKPVGEKYIEPFYEQEEYVPGIPETTLKTVRLRELKALLDDKIITPEEFEKEKKKILNE